MNKQSPKDHIESRFSVPEIRQMYAKCRAKKTIRHDFRDLPTPLRREAGMVDIDAAVEYVAKRWAKRWAKFNR